jgi:hypothetical protein
LTHSLKPPGFKPVPLNINPGFQNVPFKLNLRHYRLGDREGPREEPGVEPLLPPDARVPRQATRAAHDGIPHGEAVQVESS